MRTINPYLVRLLIVSAIVALFFALTSCVTQKACDKKFPPQTREIINIKDSTVIKDSVRVQIKDSTVIKDSIVYKAPSEGSTEFEDKGGDFTHTFKQDGNEFTVTRKNGKFRLTYKLIGTISRFQQVEKHKDTEIALLKEKLQKSNKDRQKSEVHVRVVKHTPWWVDYLIVICVLLAIPYLWKMFVRFVLPKL